MKILGVSLLSLVLLAAAPAPVAAKMHGGEHASLEELLVQMAETPAEHRALARYYRGKAADLREKSGRHRSMGEVYTGTKLTQRKRMQRHCEDIAGSLEKAAEEYEALAEEHETAAQSQE